MSLDDGAYASLQQNENSYTMNLGSLRSQLGGMGDWGIGGMGLRPSDRLNACGEKREAEKREDRKLGSWGNNYLTDPMENKVPGKGFY